MREAVNVAISAAGGGDRCIHQRAVIVDAQCRRGDEMGAVVHAMSVARWLQGSMHIRYAHLRYGKWFADVATMYSRGTSSRELRVDRRCIMMKYL
jgi:hypothetical protein